MQIGSFELQVVVNDRPVREYGLQGKTYVEGKLSSRFTLKFRNNTAQRVLAVPSVDGLSAVDGQPATGASKGYIIPAYSAGEIKGWKTNLRETADFVFADRSGSSYAAQTAGSQNCGVIAVKVFAEKPAPLPPVVRHTIVEEHHHHHHDHYPWRPWPTIMWGSSTLGGSSAQYSCDLTAKSTEESSIMSASLMRSLGQVAETPDFNLGTGFGQIREDVVSEALFDRGLELATFEIYYSDAAALVAVGVELNKAAQISKPVPQAFGGFCRPPAVSS